MTNPNRGLKQVKNLAPEDSSIVDEERKLLAAKRPSTSNTI
ncbi:hypothetical protein [Legionella longbeachae]|nr:hypothetical protein [Legionella longbeachae]